MIFCPTTWTSIPYLRDAFVLRRLCRFSDRARILDRLLSFLLVRTQRRAKILVGIPRPKTRHPSMAILFRRDEHITFFFSFFNHAKSDPSYADCAQEKKIRWLLWARTNWISTWTDLRYTPKFLWWSRIQSTSQDGQCAWKKKGADTITTTTTKKFTIVFGRGGWSVATGE